MFRTIVPALLLLFPMTLRAEDAPRFKFVKGQSLNYLIIQTTKVNETTIDEKTNKPVDQEYLTKHTVQRCWKVTEVDDKGVATLEMSILSMKWEQKQPNGDLEEFDSAKPDDLNKNEMAKLIGQVLAVVQLDSTGKLIEVKESKFGSKSRFVADLPFKMVLPETEFKEGQAWERTFTITLDPPQGTGEKYEATQKYATAAPSNGLAVIGVTTAIKEMPAQASDQIPLFPLLLEGKVYFHAETGRYQGARMKLKKELMNHAGEGTKYTFDSTYQEDFKIEK